MKAISLSALIISSTLTSTFVYSNSCSEPERVKLPNGRAATTDQMVAGQKQVKKYIADAKIFLACLGKSEDAAGDTLTEKQKMANIKLYNSVVDNMEKLKRGYNKQIRDYKAAKSE